MWAMLRDVARSQPLGRKETPEAWKCIFMNGCGWETRFLEGLSGEMFPAGFRSSNLSAKQMSDLLAYIEAEGTRLGVKWTYKEKGWDVEAP